MSIYLPNKYTKCYNNIISNASNRIIEGYTEKHHIIPKSLGGSNEPSNLVCLTAREHYLCHWLLTKMTTGKSRSKMCLSFVRTCHNGNVSARQYQFAKEYRSKYVRGKNHPVWGLKHNKETRKKMSLAGKGRKKSKEHKEKIGISNRKNITFRGNEYHSITECMKQCKVSTRAIYREGIF